MGVEPTGTRPPVNINELNAKTFANQMEKIQGILRGHILLAQADYEEYANRHRGTAPQYRVSDLVWLDTQNLFTKRPCRKLKNRRAGPYPVRRVVNTHAIELTLPEDVRVYPVFHVNLFEPVAMDKPHLGHIQPPSPLIEVDGETK